MKPAIVLLPMAILASGLGIAQKVTLIPQLGLEQSRSAISVNNVKQLIANYTAPAVGLRLNVSTKTGHGMYASVATNRSGVAYQFVNPETAGTEFTTQPGSTRLVLGGGYQFNTKKIKLGSGGSTKARSTQPGNHHGSSMAQRFGGYSGRCGGYGNRESGSRGHCGMQSRQKQQMAKAKSWYMSLQPSIGMAFAPGASQKSSYMPGQKMPYTYTAGEWKTAIMPGISAEFGQGNDRQFTVSLNYLQGIGRFGDQQIEETNALKSNTVQFASKASAWTLQIGVPLSLNKKSHVTKARPASKCLYYRAKCQRYRTI